ncbi:MAG: 50S ribosomal protein L13 [Candidatus Aenigmarchaeota archaeon]|nr:50S ribosomal protein L13 [Candidatus Aenigmarchaeota archaeon]
MIIDGTNAVLGRLASSTAKKLLSGQDVKIVHAENVIITGNPTQITKHYLRFKAIGSPQHGPFYPRRPDMIVRRTIRGMLPKTKKGRNALKKLRVEIGNPDNEKGEQAAVKHVKTDYITIGTLAKQLGWRE